MHLAGISRASHLEFLEIIVAALALVVAILLVARCGSLRGTTLVAPSAWAAAAFALLAAAELAAWSFADHPIWISHLRFLAAGATFCPLMALLGAKRPQDRGWQFVVLSLLGLIVFYGLTELAYRPDRPPALHWVVRWLLIAPLVTIGLLNHLLTRYWLPAILVAVGQVLLLSPQFPELQGWLPAWLTEGPRAGDAVALVGIACLSAAALVVCLAGFPGRRRVAELARVQPPRSLATSATNESGFDRVWLDFRDAYGALWGLRVAARFNQSAQQLGWGVRLGWRGLEATVGPHGDRSRGRVSPRLVFASRRDVATCLDPSRHEQAMRQVLQSLLRRFVDADWLAARWREDGELGASPKHLGASDAAGCAESAGPLPARNPTTRRQEG